MLLASLTDDLSEPYMIATLNKADPVHTFVSFRYQKSM